MPSKPKYNNDEYRIMITEFFGEIFYLPELSYGTKIQKIRQYVEIILRRILNYPCDNNIEIGNEYTIEKLDKNGFTEPLFRDALEYIRRVGNERTHTKWRKVAEEMEFQDVLDSLFNIYGYLFYKFFKKYPFGSNMAVISAFSCLPPIIRHITLSELYKDEPNNTIIIEKLVLAKLKAFDLETADTWLEKNKDVLIDIYPEFDSEDLKQLILKFGIENAYSIATACQTDLYTACKSKIRSLDKTLDSKPLYKDFETAKAYYKEHGIVEGETPDVAEFNDLMEFVYIGRRTNEIAIARIPEENYLINQIIIYPMQGR